MQRGEFATGNVPRTTFVRWPVGRQDRLPQRARVMVAPRGTADVDIGIRQRIEERWTSANDGRVAMTTQLYDTQTVAARAWGCVPLSRSSRIASSLQHNELSLSSVVVAGESGCRLLTWGGRGRRRRERHRSCVRPGRVVSTLSAVCQRQRGRCAAQFSGGGFGHLRVRDSDETLV